MPAMSLFHTLVADPPWPHADPLPGPTRGAAHNYPCMTIDQIAGFLDDPANGFERDPVTGGIIPLRYHIAPDCRLFLWRVAAGVEGDKRDQATLKEEALRVMRAWGFCPKSEVVWCKTSKLTAVDPFADELPEGGKQHNGMGRTFRNAHETCEVGVVGRPERLDRSIRSWFMAPYTGQHSGKPEVFYREIVERLSPGPYLELFGRRTRAGWTVLGGEAPVARDAIERHGIQDV